MINIFLDDCMNVMKKYEDNHFDLAIVDPPYGMGDVAKFTPRKSNCAKNKIHKDTNWNFETPKKKYWKELFRISKNQIVWGANYMTENLPISRGWIFWDKGYEKTNNFSAGELAWTSFDKVLIKYTLIHRILPHNTPNIHPTQKPVKLYQWLLHNYSEKGQKILDTHLGSGSIAVACHYFGVDLVGIEIDEEYYNKAKERVNELTKQGTLF